MALNPGETLTGAKAVKEAIQAQLLCWLLWVRQLHSSTWMTLALPFSSQRPIIELTEGVGDDIT